MPDMNRKGGTVRHKKPDFVTRLVNKFADPPDIAIGFPVGKSASTQYPDGTSVVDVAFWNNYGTKNHDGTVHIPARPFLDVGGLNAAFETKELRKNLLKKIRSGEIDMNKAADMVGAKAAAIMKRTIRDFDDPPNAPSTIRRKKSANPLIDTGLMVQSVTWEVRKRKKS